MIYNNNNITNLDLKKYNRHFSFGCSFTNYYWPTWADLISHDMPGTHYVNTAKPGAGNSYILAKLSQAMRYYNIGEGDLVSVMWTTFYRQDSYRHGDWCTPGNIFTQNMIPFEIVEQYLDDTVGFAQRDYAIVDTAVNMIKEQSYDAIMMWGVDPSKQDHYGLSTRPLSANDWTGVQTFYKDLDHQLLPDLMNAGCGGRWGETFSFDDGNGSTKLDYHPKTKTYYNYLKTIGINLSDSTGNWADECDAHTATLTESDLSVLHKWHDFI